MRWQLEGASGRPVRPGDDPIIFRIDGDVHVLTPLDALAVGDALTIVASRAMSGAHDHHGHTEHEVIPDYHVGGE